MSQRERTAKISQKSFWHLWISGSSFRVRDITLQICLWQRTRRMRRIIAVGLHPVSAKFTSNIFLQPPAQHKLYKCKIEEERLLIYLSNYLTESLCLSQLRRKAGSEGIAFHSRKKFLLASTIPSFSAYIRVMTRKKDEEKTIEKTWKILDEVFSYHFASPLHSPSVHIWAITWRQKSLKKL